MLRDHYDNCPTESIVQIQDMSEDWVETFPGSFEINGKLMHVDTHYPSSARGLIKLIQVIVCFLALILVCSSQPVQDERGIPMLICSAGIIISFFLLISYTLLINIKCQATAWYIMEVVLYLILVAGFIISGLLMAIFCARHWADINPVWETMPAIASGVLFVCALLYLADLLVVLLYWKRWSWHPTSDFENEPRNSVLPS
ncbi:unnamed protein product [Auanema sp. JU1783]|nr:unnamed protein product [Auanema sp. JU1783]